MPSIYSQRSETSKCSHGTSSTTNTKSKSIRNMFTSNKRKGPLSILKSGSTDNADRTDNATRRGGGESNQNKNRRDPPAGNTVEEKEISKFNDKGNEFFGRAEYNAALRMYSEALKLLKYTNIVMDEANNYENDVDVDGGDDGDCYYMPTAMRRFRTARCLVNVGAVHIRRDNYKDAISALELSMRQSGLVTTSSSHYYQIRASEVMADAMENIGLVLFKQTQFDKSSVMYMDALDARRKCLDLMDALSSKKQKKKGSLSKSAEELAKLQEERNSSMLELSVTLFYISLLRERQNNIAEAVNYCEEALSTRREVIPNAKLDPNSLNLFSTIGRLYCHEDIKRYQDALSYFHEVHRMKCEVAGRDHLDVVPSLNSIAFIFNQIGDYEKCIVISDRAIDIATNGRGLNKETCVAYANRGDAHRNLEDYDKAVTSYETALETQEKCLEENDMINAEVHEKLAETYLLSNDMERAVASMEDSVGVKRSTLGSDSEELARSYSKLGEYYKRSGEYSSSIKYHTRALRVFKHHDRKEMAATEHNKIAGILKLSGEPNKAMEHYMAALWHSREARLPSTDPIVADTIKNVASFQKG